MPLQKRPLFSHPDWLPSDKKGHVQILLSFISPFIPGASCSVGTKSNHCAKKAREPEGKEDRAASIENTRKTRASTASPFQPFSALSPPQSKERSESSKAAEGSEWTSQYQCEG